MTLDGNDAPPSRTRRLRGLCIAFLLECHAPFHLVLWGTWAKGKLAFPVNQWLTLSIMLVLYSARLVKVKWSGKDLFLALWWVRHSAHSQCREDHPSLVLRFLLQTAKPKV